MKNLKSIIAIIAIGFATSFSSFAIDKKPEKISQKLRTEIITILGEKINLELQSDTSAEISFVVNNENELVVVNVDSDVREFQSFVKTKLNYKKINVKGVIKGEIYKIPVTLEAN